MARAIVLILRSGPQDRVSKDAPSQSNRLNSTELNPIEKWSR